MRKGANIISSLTRVSYTCFRTFELVFYTLLTRDIVYWEASPPVKPKKPVNADHLARAVEDRVEKVEESVTEMKTMMAKVLRAMGVKEKGKELTDSPVEVSSDDEFVEVRSRKKKRWL